MLCTSIPLTAVIVSPSLRFVPSNCFTVSPLFVGSPILASHDCSSEILKSGLKNGDKVVTDGVMKVVPNKPVNIVN